MHFQIPLIAVTILAMTGCTTMRSTDPQRTASEQLLISTAADKAAESLALNIPKGNRVFVEPANFEGYDSKYAIGAIRDHVLQQGLRLTDDKAKADTIVEIRSGALSIDERGDAGRHSEIGCPHSAGGKFYLSRNRPL